MAITVRSSISRLRRRARIRGPRNRPWLGDVDAIVDEIEVLLSERTVETHLVSVYGKLGVRSKTELIRRASEFGL